MRKISIRLALVLTITVILTGCGGNDDTIQGCIISNTSYTSQKELDLASQPDNLIAEEKVYASVHFIETPKGMEYTAKWYLDGTEIKTETKKTVNDRQDVVVYELDAKQALVGTLKLELIYKDTVLLTKELKIQ
jgi:hypothetical protein